MRVRARYEIADMFEVKVADAVARQPQARAKAASTASKVSSLATANISGVAPASSGARGLKQRVMSEIKVKDAGKIFRRKRRAPVGSEIPVYLVISDNPYSSWFEFGRGSGKNFPSSHFMAIAKRAARGVGMVMR
jgi:hypothetical protein